MHSSEFLAFIIHVKCRKRERCEGGSHSSCSQGAQQVVSFIMSIKRVKNWYSYSSRNMPTSMGCKWVRTKISHTKQHVNLHIGLSGPSHPTPKHWRHDLQKCDQQNQLISQLFRPQTQSTLRTGVQSSNGVDFCFYTMTWVCM